MFNIRGFCDGVRSGTTPWGGGKAVHFKPSYKESYVVKRMADYTCWIISAKEVGWSMPWSAIWSLLQTQKLDHLKFIRGTGDQKVDSVVDQQNEYLVIRVKGEPVTVVCSLEAEQLFRTLLNVLYFQNDRQIWSPFQSRKISYEGLWYSRIRRWNVFLFSYWMNYCHDELHLNQVT